MRPEMEMKAIQRQIAEGCCDKKADDVVMLAGLIKAGRNLVVSTRDDGGAGDGRDAVTMEMEMVMVEGEVEVEMVLLLPVLLISKVKCNVIPE